MKILSIEVENIKRLSAVAITPPDGDPVVIVGGRNAAGKSSVLDSIAMALGGKDLCPSEPIRRGAKTGSVSVDLGDYRVSRRFTRGADGEIKSALTVESPDGARYKSPQALLDKLVSDLTFDPLGFLALPPREQREQVRRLVGLDFSALDEQRATAVGRAEQLRVAVAMGLAQNPTLRVLLVKHGNDLDSSSLRLLASLADEHGAQVWLERVAESADGVTVLIEDGAVKVVEAVA